MENLFKCPTCGGSMQNPDLSSLNRNCPDCHDGKLRLEVEREMPSKSVLRRAEHQGWLWRPLTVSEVEELKKDEGRLSIKDLLLEVRFQHVTYKGQGVRVK